MGDCRSLWHPVQSFMRFTPLEWDNITSPSCSFARLVDLHNQIFYDSLPFVPVNLIERITPCTQVPYQCTTSQKQSDKSKACSLLDSPWFLYHRLNHWTPNDMEGRF